MSKTTIKTTDQLRAGDLVRFEGCIFKLTTCTVWHNGTMFAWQTECLTPQDWRGPKHWLADWIMQGNLLRDWDVIAA